MDRRLHNRINARLGADEQVFIENDTELVPCNLLNFSGGGALLAPKESGHNYSVGEFRNLFFDNGGQPLELRSTVIRSEPDRIAFQFCALDAEQKRAIETKLIRMAIISARLRGNDGRVHAAGPQIHQREERMPVREGQQIEEQQIIET